RLLVARAGGRREDPCSARPAPRRAAPAPRRAYRGAAARRAAPRAARPGSARLGLRGGAPAARMTDDLLVEREGPIALLTFNRPDARNAMTFEMYEALHDACAQLDADPRTRVLVLMGAGDRAVASGTDIRQFVDFKTAQDALSYEARLTRILSKLAGMSKSTVAMLQGDAIGGGLFIALACDLRLSAPHARFGVPVA